jgi:ADP-heptose:LPS heptosyltransferase
MKKILILRFSSIGDIVLTTPVIRCLKKQGDDFEVHYCTKKNYQGLLLENPYVDKVHTLGDDLNELVAELKAEKFDYIIDLHNSLRTFIIKKKLGVKAYTFDKLNLKKYLFVNLKINKMPNVHIVDRYMDTVKPLGVVNDELGLDYFYPEKDEVEKEWLPIEHQSGYSAFAIGGQHATKKLPIDKLIELCAKINGPIVLLGGKEDEEAALAIEQFFDDSKVTKRKEEFLENELHQNVKIFNGVGKFNLNQSASLVKFSTYVFTHDTGVMHIAAAFKKEIFSIWGNTTPFFGMYPYQTKFTIFEVKDLKCRPCSKIGYNSCPKGHFKCMNNQQFDLNLEY